MISTEAYTVELFVKSNNDKVSYDNLSLFENDKDNDLLIYNLINEYLDELKEASVEIELTDDEYYKYLYKPKLLAYDIYGSTELFFLILLLNNICNVKEFNFRKVKMLSIDKLNNLLSIIYNKEETTVIRNRNELSEAKKEENVG